MKFKNRFLLASLLGIAIAGDATALSVCGLTAANSLVRFDSSSPGTINSTVAVTGLSASETLAWVR